jgi:hypothetical protein
MRPRLVSAALALAAVLGAGAGAALAQPLTLCRNTQGQLVRCTQTIAPVVPAGATARCRDGTFSFNHHIPEACAGHGGVAQRYE